MAAKTGNVRIGHGALDESPLRGGTVIVRGVVDATTLQHLQVDDYQREQAPVTSKSSIWRALEAGEVLPDIELGMRSEKFESRGSTFDMKDDVWIIDGLQRVGTALQYLQQGSGKPVRLGCLLHFNTTREWERERFKILNSSRSKVSPSVLLRNEREDSVAVNTLYGLTTNDKNFVLYGRVCWNQKMARSELITALALTKVVTHLHTHKRRAQRTSLSHIVPILDEQLNIVGNQIFKDNIRTFFEVVDECWGIRLAQYQGAPHLRTSFLKVLARVFSDHKDFWVQPDERRFFVGMDMRRKLALLKTNDPAIAHLAGAAGKGQYILYCLIRDHINSGKRTKRLISRNPEGEIQLDDVEDNVA